MRSDFLCRTRCRSLTTAVEILPVLITSQQRYFGFNNNGNFEMPSTESFGADPNQQQGMCYGSSSDCKAKGSELCKMGCTLIDNVHAKTLTLPAKGVGRASGKGYLASPGARETTRAIPRRRETTRAIPRHSIASQEQMPHKNKKFALRTSTSQQHESAKLRFCKSFDPPLSSLCEVLKLCCAESNHRTAP